MIIEMGERTFLSKRLAISISAVFHLVLLFVFMNMFVLGEYDVKKTKMRTAIIAK